MQVTRVDIVPVTTTFGQVAYVNVVLDGSLALNELRLCRKPTGEWYILYPTTPSCFRNQLRYFTAPLNRDVERTILSAVVIAYQQQRKGDDTA